jgi:hypothetical protein
VRLALAKRRIFCVQRDADVLFAIANRPPPFECLMRREIKLGRVSQQQRPRALARARDRSDSNGATRSLRS